MTRKEFHDKFPAEFACRYFWKGMREKTGIVCRKCKKENHYWNHGKNERRSRNGNTVTIIKSGTVMMHSNLSLMVWFKPIFEVSYRGKSISTSELYKQLPEVKSEGSARHLLHNIRRAMGFRDEKYQSEGKAEVDVAFVSEVKEIKNDSKKSKRGRGAVRKAPILSLASYERTPSGRQKRNRPRNYPLFFKMFQWEDLKKQPLNETVFRYGKLTSHVKSFAHRVYSYLNERAEKHTFTTTSAKEGHMEPPCVHCAIGNVKGWINGIFHHVSEKYLEDYLDEFVYTLNRRNVKRPFDHLLNYSLVRPCWES